MAGENEPDGEPRYGQRIPRDESPVQPPAYGQQPVYGEGFGQQPGYGAGFGQPDPAQQYGQPYGAGAFGPTSEKNNLGNIGLIASIVGIVGSFIPVVNVIAGFGGIVGLVLGILGLRAAKAGRATNRGMSIAAIVVGAVQILLAILVIIGLAAFLSTYETGFESL